MKARLVQCLLALLLSGAAIAGAQAPQPTAGPVEFNIPAEPVDKALNDFAHQTGLQVVVDSKEIRGIQSSPVLGRYTPERGLDLLLANTGLVHAYLRPDLVTVSLTPPKPPKAHTDMLQRNSQARDEPKSVVQAALEEIVITTGSNIPGASLLTGSPISVYTLEDIERAGAFTTESFMALLTQNYGGGQSEFGTLHTLGSVPGQPNPSFGTGPNLRGLGSSSTLVLVDGHRLAPSGYSEFTDLSMIPFAAIDRVEVLTDGASALYGSDAVGGVVNFILKRDFKRESAVRLGTSTHGDARTYDTSQALGGQWNSGSFASTLQILGRGSISSEDRDFSVRDATAPQAGARDLLPQMTRESFTAVLSQNLTEKIELSIEGWYTHRREKYDGCNAPCTTDSSGLYTVDAASQQYLASVGLSTRPDVPWHFEATASASENWLHRDLRAAQNSAVPTLSNSGLYSIEAAVSGSPFRSRLPNVKISAGASLRSEVYEFDSLVGALQGRSMVSAGYGEILFPLFGFSSDTSGLPRLTLTLAGRYEHYSSFGTTFNPKLGVRLDMSPSLTARGTYGSAFKAPNPYQLSAGTGGRYLQPLNTGTANPLLTLIRYGGNPGLREQSAGVWTLGLDWNASADSGIRSQLTYFNIDYKRIIWDLSTVPLASMLASPAYSPYVLLRGQINDPAFNELASAIIGDARLVGCTPPSAGQCTEPVSDINAIMDQRQTNLAASQTSGIDWHIMDRLVSSIGRFDIDVAATYIIDFRERVTPISDAAMIVSTAGNPTRSHVRASVEWGRGHWTVGTTVNFTSGYSTSGSLDAFGDPLPFSSIPPWTAADLQIGYNTAGIDSAGTSKGVYLALRIDNLFDRDPPYVDDAAYGFGYDPANATPFGRRVSFYVSARW